MNKKNHFVYMCHACTLSMPTFSLLDGALDARAKQMKPQVAVSYPDKINQHQFGGDCQVMMAEGGEKSHENVVDEDLVVKKQHLCYTYCIFGFRREEVLQTQVLCKTCEQLLQVLEEIQPTSITTCNTTKTYTNNSKPTLATINCIVNNMLTSIYVYYVYRHCNTELCYRTCRPTPWSSFLPFFSHMLCFPCHSATSDESAVLWPFQSTAGPSRSQLTRQILTEQSRHQLLASGGLSEPINRGL